MGLMAGNFVKVTDDYESGRIPLALYVRRYFSATFHSPGSSMDKFLDSKIIFEFTKSSMAFYEEFFDIKYPFAKYDQLFLPEFVGVR